MPCAAPCDRLPCDERCTRLLKCGHQCPSLCGEECPHDYCQACCARKDNRVDLLEFKTYEEIDLDETPIIVLGCGHFFTAETLDGLVGMHEVYTTDRTGRYNGLKDSTALATAVPSCPDCKRPIRQFTTKRYNRVINRAVMDETSKRFLTSGRQQLTELEDMLQSFQEELESSRNTFKRLVRFRQNYGKRWEVGNELATKAMNLSRNMREEHQPAKGLLDAVLTFQRNRRASDSLEEGMENLKIDSGQASRQASTPAYDQQITLGAKMVHIKAKEAILQDAFHLSENFPSPFGVLRFCKEVVAAAFEAKLPRLVIAASLSYGRIVQIHERTRRKHRISTANKDGAIQKRDTEVKKEENDAEDRVETAKRLLGDAQAICDTLPNTDSLKEAIEGTLRLFRTEWYEEVTPEEMAAIKTAMVSGSGGIATHSGHWYNCANGHPVSSCLQPLFLCFCSLSPFLSHPLLPRRHWRFCPMH